MTDEQFDRLIQAIQANTAAQLEVATALLELTDATAEMAQAYAGEDEAEEEQPLRDMAGRPILPS